LALTRAKAAVCTIAERIQRVLDGFSTNWSTRYQECATWEAWKGGEFHFSNRNGYAVMHVWNGSDEPVHTLQVIEAVDGPIAVFDPCTQAWCAIGIATASGPGLQNKVSWVEIPRFVADHIGQCIRSDAVQAA
jgi:hypothetical protein